MPQKKKAEGLNRENLCKGGRSYNRENFEHERGRVADILCFRCKTRMGCSKCCDPMSELICLYCDDWATKVAVARHGPMLKPEARGEILTLLRLMRSGEISPAEAMDLYRVNFHVDPRETFSTRRLNR